MFVKLFPNSNQKTKNNMSRHDRSTTVKGQTVKPALLFELIVVVVA
jgi:hypothetical protein